MFYKIEKERPNRLLDSTDMFLIIEVDEKDVFMEFVPALDENNGDGLNYDAHTLRINLENDPVLAVAMNTLFGNKDGLVFIADMKGEKTKGFMIHDRFPFPVMAGEDQDDDQND